MAPSGNACAQMTGKPLIATADVIGGFSIVEPNCGGCGQPLLLENAWMTDGCPCNCVLGTNNHNETRWRLLMQLQQQQSMQLAEAKAGLRNTLKAFEEADKERLEETAKFHADAEKWKGQGDMIGWNFYQGLAGGTTWASLYFGRARRALEAVIFKA